MKNNDVTILEKTKEHFNETAANYDNTFDGKFVQPMYQCLLDTINLYPHHNLLDLGCGNGNILFALKDYDMERTGIDLSEKMIEQSKKRLNDSANLLVADAEKTTLPDHYFDMVICNASFHHYPHPDAALKELKRIMKRDAILLIGEGYVMQPVRALLNLSFKYSKSGDFHSYGKRELTKLVEQNGFTMLEIKKSCKSIVLYIIKSI